MPFMNAEENYRTVWNAVRESYYAGYCVSERGLQALMYSNLAKAFHTERIIVEPCWEIDGSRIVPDLVVASSQHIITDIFELKFVPHHLADGKDDLRKLIAYIKNNEANRYPIRLNPGTGQWSEDRTIIAPNCQLHFVAVSRHDASAVWPEYLKSEVPELGTKTQRIRHWYGRVGGQGSDNNKWAIQNGI